MIELRVALSPALFSSQDVVGAVVIVIDLLRASTTITSALAAGAAQVIPCEEITEAKLVAARFPSRDVLLGGERKGLPIEGFNLGNGPHEYTRERVLGKTIVFTTTNGTRAIRRAARADHILIGCFHNLDACARLAAQLSQSAAASAPRPVVLCCAGIHDQPCIEDALVAGALAERLSALLEIPLTNDSARLAVDAWQGLAGDDAALVRALESSQGGRNLARIGLADQIAPCAAINTTRVVPRLTAHGSLIAAPADPA